MSTIDLKPTSLPAVATADLDALSKSSTGDAA